MRLISQDGMIDVPYEISALSIGVRCESATIYVRSKLLDERPCVFATYSNTDKALKVMEKLRDSYSRFTNTYNIIFRFPKDDEVEV